MEIRLSAETYDLFSVSADEFTTRQIFPIWQMDCIGLMWIRLTSSQKPGEEMNTVPKPAPTQVEAAMAKTPPVLDRTADRERFDLLPWLPCTLALDIPVVKFTVADLLGLTDGSIVETAYHQSSDLPLRVNGQLVGWTEFEVVGERLAVRLTDLS